MNKNFILNQTVICKLKGSIKMHKDDISRLYKQLGVPVHGYLDFQMEENFRVRIDELLKLRALAMENGQAGIRSDSRRNKVVAVVSTEHLPGRKLVASLAWMASYRAKGKLPVRIVDLITFDGLQEEKTFLLADGVKHVLLDTSEQVEGAALVKDSNWIEREIIGDGEEGFVVVDVPEQVMHMRHDVLATTDVLLVLVPATLAAVFAVEEIERELVGLLSFGIKCSVVYLLVATDEVDSLSPLLLELLLSQERLFMPFVIQKDAIPSAYELSFIGRKDSMGYEMINKILSFILGRVDS